MIWDIAAAAVARSSNARVSTTTKTERPIVQQYALAESVSSLTFLPEDPNALVAGVSSLWLRLFDLRSATLHVAQAPAAKVNGIVTDPFEMHRFACFSETSVTIWDCRRFVSPLLTFSLKDAAADGARRSSPDSFTNAEFSPVRRGQLATLTRDANHVRFWDIQKIPSSEVPPESEDTTYRRTSSTEATRSSKLSRLSSTMLSWNAPSEQPRTPTSEFLTNVDNVVLSDTRRSMYSRSWNKTIDSHLMLLSKPKHFLALSYLLRLDLVPALIH